jgi:calcineurin-like phosphoesterase family protein
MSKRYIADQHFFDEDVRVKMDKRPFDNCEEKNSYMIDQWNSVVRGGDDVYVLGDMFDWKGAGSALPINKVLHKLILSQPMRLYNSLYEACFFG